MHSNLSKINEFEKEYVGENKNANEDSCFFVPFNTNTYSDMAVLYAQLGIK